MVTLPVDSTFASAIRLQRETDRLNRIQIDAHRKAVDQAQYWDRIGGSSVVAGANALAANAGSAERERADIARFLEGNDGAQRAGIGRFADVSSLATVKSEIAGGVHASEMLNLASRSAGVALARDLFPGDSLTRTAAQAMGATVSDMFKDAAGMTGVSARLRDIMGMEATRADAQFRALIGNIPSGLDAMLASVRDAVPAWKSRADAYAAYGPFVHREREPPLERWYKPADYSTDERPDASPEPFEKNEAGIYVPNKGGRPAGPSLLIKSRFIETVRMCAEHTGQPPTIDRYVAYMCNVLNIWISESSVKRYCRAWNLRWIDLRNEMANC